MTIIKSEDKMINEIKICVEELRNIFQLVERKSDDARQALYGLLSDCVDFHKLLNAEAGYQAAFKRVIDFKWNKHAKLTILIAKTVFGVANKNAYAYSKVMDAAISAGIDNEGAQTVAQWLEQSGGVNRVIRNTQSSSNAAEERKQRIEVGRNAKLYGVNCKLDAFHSAELERTFGDSSEVVLLLSRDAKTGKISLIWRADDEALVEAMYEDLGSGIMKLESYHEKKLKVEKLLRKKHAAENQAVLDELKKLTTLSKLRAASNNNEQKASMSA